LVYEFLNKINTPTPYSYIDIDHLWVAPREYDELRKILEKDSMVVITDPPEYGKTYTAIRILWEYYHYKGCLPILFEMKDRE
jgi:hypothetical protein